MWKNFRGCGSLYGRALGVVRATDGVTALEQGVSALEQVITASEKVMSDTDTPLRISK